MFTAWRKSQARKAARRARARAFAAEPQAGARLSAHFPDEIWPPLHAVVAGYRPIGDEIDPTPLMETFFCEQARLCLPCVIGRDQPLVFRAWTPDDTLVRGPMGIEQPADTASVLTPSLVLVPLLAFDRRGQRLGYGGGYYDRTLARLQAACPVTTVGLAYEAQRRNALPVSTHDIGLDWIVTEAGAFRCEEG